VIDTSKLTNRERICLIDQLAAEIEWTLPPGGIFTTRTISDEKVSQAMFNIRHSAGEALSRI
jgi:hypothetical protein